MATLPTVTYYWRQSGAANDAWTEDADGGITPTAGQTIEVVSVGPSKPAFRAADTTPTVSLTPIAASFGASVTVNPTYGGTNRSYSLSGPDWLSINPANGQITGTAPSVAETTSYTVTVSNASGTASDTETIEVSATVPTVGRTLTGSEYWTFEMGSPRDRLSGAAVVSGAVWLRVASSATIRQLFTIGLADAIQAGLLMQVQADGTVRVQARSQTADSIQSVASSSAIAADTWVHVAFECDFAGDTMDLWVNGAPAATQTTATFGATTFASVLSAAGDARFDVFGSGYNTTTLAFENQFVGDLAKLCLIRRAFTSNELATLAAGGEPPVDAIYFPMDSSVDGQSAELRNNAGLITIPTGYAAPASSGPTGASVSNLDTGLDHVWMLELDVASLGLSDGDRVASVPLGGGALAVSSGDARPTYEASTGALVFDGVDDQLTINIGPQNIGRAVSVVALMETASSTSFNAVAASFGTTTPGVDAIGVEIAPQQGMRFSTAVGRDSMVNSDPGTDPIIVTGRLTTTILSNWRNNARVTGTIGIGDGTRLTNGDYFGWSDTPGNFTGAITIGADQGGGRVALKLYRLYIVFGSITDDELMALGAKAAHAYSQAGLLPASDPYKATPPTTLATVANIQPLGGEIYARSWDTDNDFVGSPDVWRSGSNIYFAAQRFTQPEDIGEKPTSFYKRSGPGRYDLLAIVPKMWWASISEIGGDLYMLGTTGVRLDPSIAKSTDGGRTWTQQTLAGGDGPIVVSSGDDATAPVYTRGSQRSLIHDGHIFVPYMERAAPRTLNTDLPFVLYASLSDDLMNPASWAVAKPASASLSAIAAQTVPFSAPALMLEPTVLVDELGQIMLMTRVTGSSENTAIAVPLDWNGTTLTFPNITDTHKLTFTGSRVLFGWEHDPTNDRWVTFANKAIPEQEDVQNNQRHRLTAYSVPDADFSTSFAITEIETLTPADPFDAGMTADEAARRHGAQYTSAILTAPGTFDLAIRVGHSGAQNEHDSNFLLYVPGRVIA